MNFWGYHLMLDCSGCYSNVSDRDSIYNFNAELIERIDMVQAGEPIITHLLPGDPKQGYSLMQLITTSNICAHFMDHGGTAYVDIFSCKEFDIEEAKSVVSKYFEPAKMRVMYVIRHAD